MRILIIGGAGYIGGVTAHLTASQGHAVTVLDDLSTGNDYNVPAGVPLLKIDVCDRGALAPVFTKHAFDVVMHFAARILVPESMHKPYDYYHINTMGALHTIDAAARAGIKNYVFSSTAAVYGEPARVPLAEDDPTLPVNPYGTSKLLSEQLLRSYQITHGLHWTALRYFNVAGAYQNVGTDYPFVSHIIPSLLQRMQHKEPITIHGADYDTPDGTAIRDYVHVLDLARAHLLAAQTLLDGTALNQPINLGSQHGYSVKEVAETFNKVTGAQLPITYGPRRAGDPAKLYASNARAKALLQWQPELTLEQIITDHFQWYQHAARRNK